LEDKLPRIIVLIPKVWKDYLEAQGRGGSNQLGRFKAKEELGSQNSRKGNYQEGFPRARETG